MKCPEQKCPCCGDTMIHQTNRGSNESSSAFGQHIHSLKTTFFWLDVDGIIAKLATGILRIVEHKFWGQEPRPSQKCVLPLLATGIGWLVKLGLLHEQSGVFVVISDPPFTVGLVQKVRPIEVSLSSLDFNSLKTKDIEISESSNLQGREFLQWKTGEILRDKVMA